MEGTLTVRHIDHVTVATLQERSILGTSIVDAIARELYKLPDLYRIREVVLDCTKVQFVASSMLGVLVALQRKVAQIGGRLVLCGVRPELMTIFRMMRLHKSLPIADDEAQALKCFGVECMA
jgi:anti-anti-sigma factor